MIRPGDIPPVEIAQEFLDMWKEFEEAGKHDMIARLLARNVPIDLLTFFSEAGTKMIDHPKAGTLLAMGYVIRLLHERIK